MMWWPWSDDPLIVMVWCDCDMMWMIHQVTIAEYRRINGVWSHPTLDGFVQETFDARFFPWWQRSQSIRKADASDFSVQGHNTASLLKNTVGQHQTTGCPTLQEFVSFAYQDYPWISELWLPNASYGTQWLSPVLPRLLPPRWWQVRWQTGRPFSAPLSTSFVPRWNHWESHELPWRH